MDFYERRVIKLQVRASELYTLARRAYEHDPPSATMLGRLASYESEAARLAYLELPRSDR